MTDIAHWRRESAPGALVITYDPPAPRRSGLSFAAVEDLARALDEAQACHQAVPVRGLVIASAVPGGFIPGFDLDDLDTISSPEVGRYRAAALQRAVAKIADFPVPVAAAIGGLCIGPGLEIALACGLRVAADTRAVRLGLPEIRLGLVPCCGSVEELARLMGLKESLDFVLSGDLVDARSAYEKHLVDLVVPAARLFEETLGTLEGAAAGGARERTLPERIRESKLLRGRFIEKLLAEAEEVDDGVNPAYGAVRELFRGLKEAEEDGLEPRDHFEARLFGELVCDGFASNARYRCAIDDASRASVARRTGEDAAGSPGVVSILGAGAGSGELAWKLASTGAAVRLHDPSGPRLLAALAAADRMREGAVDDRVIGRDAAREVFERIAVGVDARGLKRAELLVDRDPGARSAAGRYRGDLIAAAGGDCVIACEARALSIASIPEAAGRPGMWAGFLLHAPGGIDALAEIACGPGTSARALARLVRAADDLGLHAVITGDGPGFLVTRILAAAALEAARAVDEGVAALELDRVAVEFGMAEGFLGLFDRLGLDVLCDLAEARAANGESAFEAPAALRELVAAGHLGRAAGRGFHEYEAGRLKRPWIARAVDEEGGEAAGIEDRLIFALLFEACRALEDGTAGSGEELEAAVTYGAGFPGHRGGVLRWASSIGASDLARRADALRERHGGRYALPVVLKRILS